MKSEVKLYCLHPLKGEVHEGTTESRAHQILKHNYQDIWYVPDSSPTTASRFNMESNRAHLGPAFSGWKSLREGAWKVGKKH